MDNETKETKTHRLQAFWIACAIAAVFGVLGGLLWCEAARAECKDCDVAYCDGNVIVDYCAPLPEYEEDYEGCPILCGIHRCDIWYQRGQCGKPRQAEG